MSTNLEIEAKATLSKLEYDKLIANFKSNKIYEQVNYYLDTKSFEIRNKKCGLRIRTKQGENELTIKAPKGDGKLEINQQISNISLQNLLEKDLFPNGEVSEFITKELSIKTSDLKVLGKLVTYRLDIEYKSSLISIDKSLYNGIEDYEIECEDESLINAQTNLKEFLKKYQIPYHENKRSKLGRFLESL